MKLLHAALYSVEVSEASESSFGNNSRTCTHANGQILYRANNFDFVFLYVFFVFYVLVFGFGSKTGVTPVLQWNFVLLRADVLVHTALTCMCLLYN